MAGPFTVLHDVGEACAGRKVAATRIREMGRRQTAEGRADVAMPAGSNYLITKIM